MPRDRICSHGGVARRALLACAVLAVAASIPASASPAAGPRALARAPASLLLDIALAGERLVAVGEYGRIVFSDDHGSTWAQAPSPTQQMLTAVFFASAATGWATGHDGLILHTSDGGDSWRVQRDGLAERHAPGSTPPPLMDIWFRDGREGWAVGAFGTLLRTRDGGRVWQDRSDLIANDGEYHYYGIVGDAAGRLMVVGEAGGLYRSLDGGDHWQTLASPYDGSWFGVVHASGSRHTVTFGLQGHIARSSDFGGSWQSARVGPGSSLAGGSITGDDLVLVGSMGQVLYSRTGARGFETLATPRQLHLSAVCRSARGDYWAVGQGGAAPLPLPPANGPGS